jgi:hypothetical protein
MFRLCPTIMARLGRGMLAPVAACLLSAPAQPADIFLSNFCTPADAVDATACLQDWIAAGAAEPARRLIAHAGTFVYKNSMNMYTGMRLRCAGSSATTFRRHEDASATFLTSAVAVNHVLIEDCGFDAAGSTEDFLAFISLNPGETQRSSQIVVRRNRFFDRPILGSMSLQQRQYIALLNCQECTVTNNHLSEGGRIKVGRPGKDLTIRNNRIEHANDNAITVVDIGTGLSEGIVIADNVVLMPRGIGIFIGADGETQADPALATKSVQVTGNTIEGHWITACIAATLPNVARDIRVNGNTCRSIGVSPPFATGIMVRRTNGTPLRAERIHVEDNRILTTMTSGFPLDHGGISVSGRYSDFRIRRNVITRVSTVGIRFGPGVDIQQARITDNVITGGTLSIPPTIQGTTSPNTVVP